MISRALPRFRAGLAGVLVGGACLVGATPASAALTGPEQIAFLNAQRAANGLPAGIVEVPEWSAGCRAHMDYLALNNKFQHHEDPGDPGYSEAGNTAGNTAVLVSDGDAFSATGENAFEGAPLHLAQMLSPFLLRSGAGGGCLATLRDVSRVFAAPATFSYPGPGATAPVSETQFEYPFVPAASVGLAEPGSITRGRRTGPSLYFFNALPGSNGRWNSGGAITAATLTGPGGPVEVRTVDNTTPAPPGAPAGSGDLGDYLPAGGIVIPVAPLVPNAVYTASVTFQPQVGGPPVQRTWSFNTGVVPGAVPAPAPAPSGGPVGGAETPGPAQAAPDGAGPQSPRPFCMECNDPPDTVTANVQTFILGRTKLKISTVDRVRGVVELRQQVRTRSGKSRSVLRRKVTVNFRKSGTAVVRFKRVPKGTYSIRIRYSAQRAETLPRTYVLR